MVVRAYMGQGQVVSTSSPCHAFALPCFALSCLLLPCLAPLLLCVLPSVDAVEAVMNFEDSHSVEEDVVADNETNNNNNIFFSETELTASVLKKDPKHTRD